MITNIYIDGFNLYFSALRKSPNKWLNPEKLFTLLFPDDTIKRIKYFTARVKPRPDDPGQPVRQSTYLRALATVPSIEIIFGHYRSYAKWLPTAQSVRSGKKLKFVEVIKTDEKGSDVNLAAHLMSDAFKKDFEQGVVVSNDTDLVEPVRFVHAELGLRVGIANAYQYPGKSLTDNADFFRLIRQGVLAASQFPDTLTDKIGTFSKPGNW